MSRAVVSQSKAYGSLILMRRRRRRWDSNLFLGAVGSAPARDATTDRIALRQFFEATGGRSWKNSAGWGSSRPLAEWYGVTVDRAGRVTMLDLEGNNLRGGCSVLLSS